MTGNGGFASLTSSLLARKGAARPAMRASLGTSLEDLGWNDMGEEAVSAPAPAVSQPLKYQETIAEEFGAVPEPIEAVAPTAVAKPSAVIRPIRAASRVTRTPQPKAQPAEGKVAFTLRLDGERHLRLRLATAVTGRSAQKIVMDALDSFLVAHPEFEELAGRVPQRKADGRN
jgi:hypothetical protein